MTARTQFTFTFTNAQPGSVVSFDDGVLDHLYADATSSTRVGRPLVLNSSNALSVWSDVETLTAATEDGVGNDISATATRDNPSVATDDGTAGQNPFSSGGSTPAGVSIVRAFPFAFDTPNLVTGHTVYTPTIGDLLLEAWVEVDTAWDGTTPLFDFGSLVGVDGLFATFAGFSNPEMSAADSASGTGGSLLQATGTHNATLSETADQSGGSTLSRVLPMKFMTADPLKVVVSTTGLKTGADPGATHGAATLYLITATPA